MATPMFHSLRRAYPAVEMHALLSPYNQKALLRNRDLDRLWVLKKGISTLSLMRHLRKERFDLAIVLHSHTPSFTNFLVAHLTGAPLVWGFNTQMAFGGNRWSRDLANVERDPPPEHHNEMLRYAELIRPLVDEVILKPQYPLSENDRAWAMDKWSQLIPKEVRPRLVFFLAGNLLRPDRLWPTSSWVKLARMLPEEWRRSLVIMGSDGGNARRPESDQCDDFLSEFGAPVAVLRERSLEKSAAFLSQANLFVCPDGGMFHVAAASEVPTIGLFVSMNKDQWTPPVPWVSSLSGDGAMPTSLSAERVFDEMLRRL